jgi:hypothetical protein
MRLHVGAIVHYAMGEGRNLGACRPALVVREWGESGNEQNSLQLVIFPDGTNDDDRLTTPVMWRTSVTKGKPGEQMRWHWPEECFGRQA